MDILPADKGIAHRLVTRHMGQHAQLDLRIVTVHQHAARPGHEGPPDLAPHQGAHRDVLQVRLDGTDAARSRTHLVKGGMDAPGGVHFAQQTLDVGTVELHDLAVFQYLIDGGMQGLEPLQRIRVG